MREDARADWAVVAQSGDEWDADEWFRKHAAKVLDELEAAEKALREIAVLIVERRDIGSYSRVEKGSLPVAVAIARAFLVEHEPVTPKEAE